MSAEWESTDVIICGCGPTGAMLSGYLGRYSVDNVVLEREENITTDPRGIALDEDGIRLVQGLGIYDRILTEIGTCMFQFKFIGGSANDLMGKPFMLMDYATTEGGTGHVGFICHKQPSLERHLRAAMASTGFSQLRSQATVTSISEDDEWVYCRYTDSEGTERRIKAKYFVGADGKTGFTRKRYLEPRGVQMERAHNLHYEETWIALNWRILLPSEKTHPDFPLWKLGFSGQDVYDAFFPSNFRFLCNAKRPAVCGRFGPTSERLWRFEFVVQDGEDAARMSDYDKVKTIVFPYLRHPGQRYGLEHDVQFPEDCIEVMRCRPFKFSARSCNKWALGRVILCGDAAHVFPPFGGQGIASGFRDAVSLSWRLAVACRLHKSGSKVNSSLLEAWYVERKQQLERSLKSTIENGQFVTATSLTKILIRDWFLWFAQLFPQWRHQLHLGNRREGMVQYAYQEGMPFIPHLKGGKNLPQVYCRPTRDEQSPVQFTDDVIWSPEKHGIFQLLVLLRAQDEVHEAARIVNGLCERYKTYLRSQEATYMVLATSIANSANETSGEEEAPIIYRLATADEFAASPLCYGRPAPQGYDPFRLGKEVDYKQFILLRPDRFVFAACNSETEADHAGQEIANLFGDIGS